MTDATITKLLDESAAPAELERPDDEELHVVVEEIREAKTAYYKLRQIEHYDTLEVPGYDGYTVGNHLFGAANAQRNVPAGFKLERAIAVAKTRIDDAQARYDELNAREEAWLASRAPKDDDVDQADEAEKSA